MLVKYFYGLSLTIHLYNRYQVCITKFQKLLIVLNYCKLTVNCITGHSDSVNKLSFSRDCSKLLSCSDDCCFKVFDSNSGLELYTNTLQCPLK